MKNSTLTAIGLACILFTGCANTLNSKRREHMSGQPPRFEAPYDQIAQPVEEKYALNYSNTTLSDTQNQKPNPIEIFPENYRTDSTKPRVTDAPNRPLEAIPAPNKPGFVISPYSPSSGLVDVREFSPGMEVRDPYTGRVMLVPIKAKEKSSDEVAINKSKNEEATGSPFLKRGAPPELTPKAPSAPIVQQGPPLTPQGPQPGKPPTLNPSLPNPAPNLPKLPTQPQQNPNALPKATPQLPPKK